jgi:hypothetical protein
MKTASQEYEEWMETTNNNRDSGSKPQNTSQETLGSELFRKEHVFWKKCKWANGQNLIRDFCGC